MKIDEHAAAVSFRCGKRSDDVGTNSSDGGSFDVDGKQATGFGGLADAPFVSAFATLGKGLRTGSCLRERGEPLLCFRADGGWHGDHAGDVRRAVKVKRGGVLRGDLARLVATEQQCADYERQKGNRFSRHVKILLWQTGMERRQRGRAYSIPVELPVDLESESQHGLRWVLAIGGIRLSAGFEAGNDANGAMTEP